MTLGMDSEVGLPPVRLGDPLTEALARPGGLDSVHDRDRRSPADDPEEVS